MYKDYIIVMLKVIYNKIWQFNNMWNYWGLVLGKFLICRRNITYYYPTFAISARLLRCPFPEPLWASSYE